MAFWRFGFPHTRIKGLGKRARQVRERIAGARARERAREREREREREKLGDARGALLITGDDVCC
jgi:hypothetical protein